MPSYLALIYLDLVLVYNSSENHYKHIVLQIYSYTIQYPVWFTFLKSAIENKNITSP